MDSTIIILGATGDLTKKKLLPSIHNLIKKKNLKNFAVVGVSSEKSTPKKLLSASKPHVKNIDKKAWKKLGDNLHYFQADFYDNKNFCGIGDFVRNIEKEKKLSGNRIFYLATLPQHFKVIADNLSKCGIAKQKKNWTRVVFEKPFGEDLKSAKKINKCIKKVFSEKQIYRIDHYLGKELVQNISVARFTNTILEPLWSNKYVDSVQIILSEDIGIEGRGTFYDKYGALKDVVQNHVLQMLSLAAMESPKKLTEKFIRDEKVKVLKSIKLTDDIVLGQFNGYKKEKGVKKTSKTETFAALKLLVDNKRWKGTPFYVFAGKNLPLRMAQIYIQFKVAPCLLFSGVCNFLPNYLAIQIQPEEGFYIQMNAKIPGKTSIAPVKLDFCHECTFGHNSPEAYENLLLDVLQGDQSAFIRTDEIEEQWNIIDKVKRKRLKIYNYKKGKYPEKADEMMHKDHRLWHLKVK